ncbi:hypothetical protein Q3G72_013856 [Acer saccharum]|nr:hypothetical protein Q3G72_013856 [Acer saccharum]
MRYSDRDFLNKELGNSRSRVVIWRLSIL